MDTTEEAVIIIVTTIITTTENVEGLAVVLEARWIISHSHRQDPILMAEIGHLARKEMDSETRLAKEMVVITTTVMTDVILMGTGEGLVMGVIVEAVLISNAML